MIGTFKAARDRVAGWSKVAAVIWAHFFYTFGYLCISW